MTNEKTISPGTAIIVAGIIIAGAIIFTRSPAATPKVADNTDTTKTAQPAKPNVDIKNVSITNEPYIGNPNAPVTIAYWSDYQCPFCKKFETGVFKQIMTEYIDTGKVKIVFKDYAFLGDDSTTAGLYGRAVWELYPAQYEAWRTAMFAKQDDEGDQGFGDEPSIQALTKTIAGIDADKVSKAVKDNNAKYQAMLDKDRTEAGTLGISGTPAFIIGKQAIAGVAPYGQFQNAINALLSS